MTGRRKPQQGGGAKRGKGPPGPSRSNKSASFGKASGPPKRGGAPSGRRPSRGGGGAPTPRRTGSKKGLGGDQVEGRQAVRELLLAGTRPVREVLMIDDMDGADILDDIIELAQEAKIAFRPMTRRKFESEALTHSHQGVLARARELQPVELDRLASKRDAFLLVLDGVTDPQNLGAILRTAECAGVTGIVLPKHRAAHITPTVTKTAAGAVEHLSMAVVGGIPTAISDLTKAGVLTVGLDMAGETSVFDMPVASDQKVALVLGAEGSGLGRLVRQRVDVVSSIPMSGDLNSLNVAMAGAIACFEVLRRRAPSE